LKDGQPESRGTALCPQAAAGLSTFNLQLSTFNFVAERRKKVARHSTALGERRYRCYLPVLAEFTRLPMHGTWPARTMRAMRGSATAISEFPPCRQLPSAGLKPTEPLISCPAVFGRCERQQMGSPALPTHASSENNHDISRGTARTPFRAAAVSGATALLPKTAISMSPD
jgi:hypothetical protein